MTTLHPRDAARLAAARARWAAQGGKNTPEPVGEPPAISTGRERAVTHLVRCCRCEDVWPFEARPGASIMPSLLARGFRVERGYETVDDWAVCRITCPNCSEVT